MKSGSNSNLHNQDSGCKIFVGGLTWNTTKEMLHNEFSKYGDIVDSIVMKNLETGNSRGFGFVTYKENSSAETAVAAGSHKIDGKIVDVKLCNPRLAAQQRNTKQKSDNCKVFVGGLPHGVTDDQIKQFFSRYGPVKEFKMMYDENKQRPRGFGFITFDSEENANQVLQEHYIQFNGKQIEVKPQIHNLKQQVPYQQHQQIQFQQAHFSGGNWNTNWNQQQNNQTQLPQPINIGSIQNNGYSVQGFNPALGNPTGINQQWGFSGHGSQQVQYANNVVNNGNAQTNWNYQYYGQTQPGYYQVDPSGTGSNYHSIQPQPLQQQLIHQHQQQQQQQHQQQHQQPPQPQPMLQPTEQQSIILPVSPSSSQKAPSTSCQKSSKSKNSDPKYSSTLLLQSNLLTSDYLQDSAFLSNANYKQSSSSSIAGTIGSNANYSDSEASSHSYYHGNSLGSNSSIAPSVGSLTSSSIVSNMSGNSSNSSSSTTSSNCTGNFSNQNHHRINTQTLVNTVNNERNHRNLHHGHNRSGGSVASSSATDVSSIYSSVASHLNNDNYGGLNDENLYNGFLPAQVGNFQRQASSYHPYRR